MKAIIFDLDGVLVNSFRCWLLAFNETRKKYGLDELGEEEFLRKHWGRSTEDNFMDFGLGKEAVEYCNSQHMRLVGEIELVSGVKETLELVKGKVKVGLATNTPRENARAVLDRFGLRNYFDVLVAGDEVDRKKPCPDMILKACELLGVKPSSALVVGDTESDVKAGEAAGCKVVKVRGNFVISNLSELASILEE